MELQPKTDAERRKVIRAAKGVYTFINLGHGDEYIAKITKRDAMEIVSLMKGAEHGIRQKRGRRRVHRYAPRRPVRCRNPERGVPQVLERSDQ